MMLFILAVQRTVKLPIPSDVKYLRLPHLLLDLDQGPDQDSQNLRPPHPVLQPQLQPPEVGLGSETLEFNQQNLPPLLNLFPLGSGPEASPLIVGV